MVWTDPVDATASVTAVTAAREKTYVLDNLRAIAEWTTYSPTVIQSGTVTKTDTYCKYKSYGGTVEVIARLTITGSGTGNNAITVSLPVTAAASDLYVGGGRITDTGTANYPVLVEITSTTVASFLRSDAPTPLGYVGVDPNFALANTDIIRFWCRYEAA